jgi:6-phosphogluconolactonase
MRKLHIYKSEKETCYAFAEWLSELVKETLDKQDRFTIFLSASDIPKLFFKILATDFIDKLDWNRMHIFWGDEKFISFSDEKHDPASALKALCESLPAAVKEHFHRIKTDISPQKSAEEYEELLHKYFEHRDQTFDLIISGMNEQGDVLSLLSMTEECIHRNEWVIPLYDKQEDLFRVTLTMSAINASSVEAFIVTGKRKEDIVQKVLKGKYEPEKYPAQRIMTSNKPIHWFLDEGAANKLIKPV